MKDKKLPIKKIMKVKVIADVDIDPDLSWIGTWSNLPKNNFSIEHEPDNPRSYNYFNSTNADNIEQAERDHKRMIGYNDGDWCCIGIRVEAEIGISWDDGHNWLMQDLGTGGLWGCESDAEKYHFDEVKNEQLRELRDVLLAFNFTVSEISKAFKDVEVTGDAKAG